ncbi:serine/threonine-protein kinase [Corynebacterium sp. sy039]|uniref:serine/threonine-protein kinase n=1 Tax=Corynebacterium sp. sy039 TaxID=2599641 RepID=UPI0011B57417|nr:serine/threonine-protein kinase [Corynebacterium sp. sy039]QDZ41760.1 serine/threonine protein kinase [Corynebacterium sp. sy039]
MTSISDSQHELQRLIGEDYQLQWIIGHGGMSTVWLADDVKNQREVAVKVLKPEFSDNNEFLSRFRNEALASEKISSDNVVATYDYREVTHHGRTLCFIVMEYVRGESLADMLARKQSLPEALALDVLEQAAHGLATIHRMGMVHRDIKPGNLLITQNGQVKITDFGIAKAAEAVPLTRTGMVVGTAQYVSPEQAQGVEVKASSDVYSLGVVGYEMLAGERPFAGDSSVSVAIAHINQAPSPLPTHISAPARELIGITLRKDPAHRYADGNELALAIATARSGHRPPQPQSSLLNQVAPQPSPTASTYALGQVAQPTTVLPAQGTQATAARRLAPAAAAAAPAARAQNRVHHKEKDRGGLGAGFAAAVLLLLLIGIGIFGYVQGWFGKFTSHSVPTTSTPAVVTHTVIKEETPEPEPEPVEEETFVPERTYIVEEQPTIAEDPQEAETVILDEPTVAVETEQVTPTRLATTIRNSQGSAGTAGQTRTVEPMTTEYIDETVEVQ